MTLGEIIITVLCAILIIGGFILFLFLRNKNKNNNSNNDYSGELKDINYNLEKKIFEIRESLNKEINLLSNELKDKQNNIAKETIKEFSAIKDELNKFKEQSKDEIKNSNANLLDIVNKQLNELNNKVDKKLTEGFENNSNSMVKVSEALGKITEAQKNLDNLNTEVTTLNSILNNSQKRGRYGEIALESILKNVFGDTHGTYATQYCLNNESKPDAVIFLPNDKILCIDSKFSFNRYQKLFDNVEDIDEESTKKEFKNDLKKQIDKINSSYIISNKTEPYAIMFIPSDGIYGYLQSDDYLYEQVIVYATKLNVIIASPATLQAILSNVRILKVNHDINKNIKKIITELRKLKEETDRLNVRWGDVSKAIDTLSNKKGSFETTINKITRKQINIIDGAIDSKIITQQELDSEVKEIDYSE